MNFSLYKFFRYIILIVFISFSLTGKAQTNENSNQINEFTIYVMPTLLPLDWSSPSTLYKSMKHCYLKTITQQDNYLLGHLAVGLKTPLLPRPLLIAQTSASIHEKVDLVLKQKVGFAIMGATMQGRLETHQELEHKLNVYTKRNKLAFIRYRINEKAAKRIINFIDNYSRKMDEKKSPSDYYGGAFWPRYHEEGSGCSAFGMAMLDLINLLPVESKDWKIDVNIPINLIGGEYNLRKKIKNKTIKRTKEWHNGNGIANVDFVKYFVYEPSIMFDWILKKRNLPDSVYMPVEENGIPGLLVDGSGIEFDENEPLFEERPEPNLFIDVYKKKINIAPDLIN